jgi:hypothetical protein
MESLRSECVFLRVSALVFTCEPDDRVGVNLERPRLHRGGSSAGRDSH